MISKLRNLAAGIIEVSAILLMGLGIGTGATFLVVGKRVKP